jgi:hypothetical protein
MAGMDPRNFRAGVQVEICPFRNNHYHHYLAHLDGERGAVEGPGREGRIAVRLAYNRAAVEFPTRTLKIVPETKETES